MDSKTEKQTEYWKKRMRDRLLTLIIQSQVNFKDIRDNARHIKLKDEGIINAINGIYTAYDKLKEEIIKAERKE